MLCRQIFGFCTIFSQIEQLPFTLFGFYQLPVAMPQRMIPLVRPPEGSTPLLFS
jgi:hypothetical protein